MINTMSRGVLTTLCAAINRILVSSFNFANTSCQCLLPDTFGLFIDLLFSAKHEHHYFICNHFYSIFG